MRIAPFAALARGVGSFIDTDSTRTIARVKAGHARAPGYGYVELASSIVRYRSHGEGDTTLVFAADPPVVLEHYDRLVSVLGERARVVILEIPGFGFSAVRRGFDFSFASATGATIAFLEALGIRDAVMCFPCVSSYLALAVAGARPDLVSRLVLCQAPDYAGALAWKNARDPKRILGKPGVGQLAMLALKRKRLPQWFGLAVADPVVREGMRAIAEKKLVEGARWRLASAFQSFLTEGAGPGSIDKPILSLWGCQDRSHATTDRTSSRLLGSRVELVEWDDIGHFPELEAPERFADVALGV